MAQINWGHPSTRGLKFAMPLNGPDQMYDLVQGRRLTLGTQGRFTPAMTGRTGLAFGSSGTSAARGTIASVDLQTAFAASQITIGFRFYTASYANDDALLMEQSITANSNEGFWIDPNESGGTFAWHFNAHLITSTNYKLAGRPAAGKWHWIMLMWDWAAAAKRKAAWVNSIAQTVS